MQSWLGVLLGILIGYVLGSLSPSFLIYRIFKKGDIRKVGTGYAGTTNIYKNVGLWAAALTALIDFFKGIFAVLIAQHFLGLSLAAALICGGMAIIGHIFPFYLRFRGGAGGATSSGLLIYCIGWLIYLGQFSWISFVMVVVIGVLLVFASRAGKLVAFIIIPLLSFLVLWEARFTEYSVAALILSAYIALSSLLQKKGITISSKGEKWRSNVRWWRFYSRPGAAVFAVFYLMWGKTAALYIIGIVALFFLLVDLIRLFSSRSEKFIEDKAHKFIKSSEKNRFSSMTAFLIAAFIIVLVFDPAIAQASILFLTFGDLFAKYFGLRFGKTHIVKSKTVEGSLAHLAACLASGYVLLYFTDFSLLIMVVGAISASFIEMMSFKINDNFTVGIIGGAVMQSMTFFKSFFL